MRGWQVSEAHFRLFTEFGKNSTAQALPERQKKLVWEATLQQSGLSHVPLDAVRRKYLACLQGKAKHSGVSVTIDADPSLTRIAHSYRTQTVAAHVMPTRDLLSAVLLIWFEGHPSHEDALLELLEMLEATSKARPRKKEKAS